MFLPVSSTSSLIDVIGSGRHDYSRSKVAVDVEVVAR